MSNYEFINRHNFPKLPRWVLTNNRPSFYDLESLTAVQMVARLYAYIEALVKDYNNFAELVNLAIDEFINAINIRLKSQDDKIQDIYDYMVDHLDEAIYNLVEQGRITLTLDYDPIEEALSFTATPIDGGI